MLYPTHTKIKHQAQVSNTGVIRNFWKAIYEVV